VARDQIETRWVMSPFSCLKGRNFMLARKASFLASISFFLAGLACCGESIPNWSAPTTWSPTKTRGGLSAMDVTNPLPFIGLAPCRIVDTRGNGAPITGGMFTGGSDVRSYALSGICGIPASARAVSLNFTVTGPTAPGFLTAWPTGGAVPPVSILNFAAGQQIANAAVVPTSATTSITVNVSAPTHVIVDINGYYYDGVSGVSLGSGEQLEVIGNIHGSTATFQNQNALPSSSGVLGFASATTGTTYGVLGLGVSGGAGAAGVRGLQEGTAGATYGVQGVTFSTAADAVGLYGHDGSGAPGGGAFASAGVRGASTSIGVLGVSGSRAVAGFFVNTAGVAQS